jgi:hypothetical protein
MPTMTITFAVNLFLEDGSIKPLGKIYPNEAKAETVANWFLGVETPRGLVVATQVVDSDGNVLNEFEY